MPPPPPPSPPPPPPPPPLPATVPAWVARSQSRTQRCMAPSLGTSPCAAICRSSASAAAQSRLRNAADTRPDRLASSAGGGGRPSRRHCSSTSGCSARRSALCSDAASRSAPASPPSGPVTTRSSAAKHGEPPPSTACASASLGGGCPAHAGGSKCAPRRCCARSSPCRCTRSALLALLPYRSSRRPSMSSARMASATSRGRGASSGVSPSPSAAGAASPTSCSRRRRLRALPALPMARRRIVSVTKDFWARTAAHVGRRTTRWQGRAASRRVARGVTQRLHPPALVRHTLVGHKSGRRGCSDGHSRRCFSDTVTELSL